ncbi:MAG: hypothetical protein LN415_06025 [Candidatus Thermoplasmatota archaeon]|nr:hypothetical protein [Candidatus Thermoplasmatota archaeon]
MRKFTAAVICLAIVTLVVAVPDSCAASPGDPYVDEVVDFWGGVSGFLGGWDKGNYNIPVSPDVALGAPDGWFVSITPGDWIIFAFTDNTMIDGPGPDIAIREIGNNAGQEKAEIWVSAVNDGVQFTSLGIIASQGWETNPTLYLDLADIGFTETVGYVKVSDGVGGSAPGFDLDAVWALNEGEVIVEADIDFDPDTLNLKSKGRWATVYIELPDGYDVGEIDASTVLLEDAISPVQDQKYGFVAYDDSYVVDHDGDGIMERMLKFLRSEVHAIVSPGVYNFKVSGELEDGTEFEGYSDPITVIDPDQKAKQERLTHQGPSSSSHAGIPARVPTSHEVSTARAPAVRTDTVEASRPSSSALSSHRFPLVSTDEVLSPERFQNPESFSNDDRPGNDITSRS